MAREFVRPINVGVNNPGDVLYVKGNANTDGSIRIIYSISDDLTIIERRTSGVWNPELLKSAAVHGYGNYADTSTLSTPLVLAPDVWISIPNDGLGSASQEQLPSGVTTLIKASGAIDISELNLDSEVYVRQDYEVTPSSNNSGLQFRYAFGAGLFTLEQTLPRLDRGAGIPYKFSLVLDYFFSGAEIIKNNPVLIQVNLTTAGTLKNIGMAVSVRNQL